MVFRWENQHTAKFVECCRQRECLWSVHSREYKNTVARERALSSMLSELSLPNLSVIDIQAKIKTIRTKYAAELKKVREAEKSGAGLEDMYVPTVPWFRAADAFLRPIALPNRSRSNLESYDEPEVADADALFEDDTQEARDVHLNNEEESPPWITASQGTTISAAAEPLRRKPRRSDTGSLSGIYGAIQELKRLSDNSQRVLTEFDAYAESIAKQLNSMPIHRALICQERIQSLLTAERLAQVRPALPAPPEPPARQQSPPSDEENRSSSTRPVRARRNTKKRFH